MYPHLVSSVRSCLSIRSRRALIVLTVLSALAAGFLQGLVAAPASAASPQWSQNVSDSFHRVTRSGLGHANEGGAYARVTVRSRVAAGRGIIGPLAPRQSAVAVLPSAKGADEQVRASFLIPAGARSGYGTFLSVLLRRQANGDAYLARVRVGVGGIIRVSLGKFVGRGTFVSLTGSGPCRGRLAPRRR